MTQPLTLEGLIAFHREMIAPEFQKIAATLEEHTAVHRETHARLDGIVQKLELRTTHPPGRSLP